ncbi:MAG: sigma-70 family RNA polymerase sigma factor [Gallintestinimicrobium sp.]
MIEKAQRRCVCQKNTDEENLGLVHHIVKRFAGRGYEVEDLFQTGTIGLMKAIDHFDLSYDVKFSTYAVPLIAGEIRRFLRDDGPVKVSRSLKDANYKLRQEAARIQTQEGRDPTLRELCEKTGIAYEDAVMAVAAAGEVESLSKPVYEGDGKEIALMDQLAARSADNTWEDAEKNRLVDRMLLKQLIDELPEQENPDPAALLRGSDAGPDRQKLGISQVQVSRMERKS